MSTYRTPRVAEAWNRRVTIGRSELNMSKAKLITVDIQATQNGLYRATSEELTALHVVSQNVEKLKDAAKRMICDIFAAQGQPVSIFEAEEDKHHTVAPWVVVPADERIAAAIRETPNDK